MKLIFTTILSLFAFGLFAQNITGIVTDEKNEPLVGATISWMDTDIGTTTDTEGRYSIKRSEEHHMLVYRFVGFQPFEICTHANNSDTLDIQLTSENNLDDVTVAARRQGQVLDRANPIQAQKLTGEELSKAACCNLSESFETNATVDVSHADAATGAKTIKLLGLTGKYIEMMSEKNPNFRGLASVYGMQYVPGPWLESIHISKGVGSVVNGYESITGQINIEYQKPQKAPKLFLNAFHSSMGMSEFNGATAIKVAPNLSTAILGHYQNNQKENDHNSDGFLDDPLVKQVNILNRWFWSPGKNWRSQFGIKVIDENRIGGQADYDMDNSRYRININTRRIEAFAKMGYILPNDRNSSFGLITNFATHDQNSFYGARTYDADQKYAYVNLLFQSYINNTNHRFTTGVTYIHDDFYDALIDGNTAMGTNRIEDVFGIYGEYTWTASNKLTLQSGLRFDHHSLYGSYLTPRLHIKYNPTEKTAIRISGGSGRRTTNPIAENSFLLASNRAFVIANDLKQEKAWNFGASITQEFILGNVPFTVIADAYRTSFDNQVIVDVDTDVHAVSFYNLDGKSYSNNYQIELKSSPVDRLDLTLAYRYSDVKSTINKELKQTPFINRFKGLFNASYATNKNSWQFDFTTQLNGDMRLPDTSANPEAYQVREKSPVYALINTQITRRFKKWELYAGVENLTNYRQHNPVLSADDPFSKYFDSSLIWGPIQERKLYAGIRITLD